jgi:hypothetical protein
MKRLALLCLLLTGCVHADPPPLYGCQDIPEFCPDRPPQPDDA